MDLERKVESLEEEIQFLRKIYEEVRPGRRREAFQDTASDRQRQRCSERRIEEPTVRRKKKQEKE